MGAFRIVELLIGYNSEQEKLWLAMTFQELQQQVLRLSAGDRQRLIQWLLSLLKVDSSAIVVQEQTQTARQPGLLRGKLGADFFAPLPEDELRLWE